MSKQITDKEQSCCAPRISARIKDFFTNTHKYEPEYRIVKQALFTLVMLLIAQAIVLYLLTLKTPSMLKYSPWLIYTSLTVVSIAVGITHLKSYYSSINCMTGMMIGMTFGMQTGMMIGTILGATNGLFFGGLTALFLSVIVGAYTGRCCGIMGVMEGMMAGSMGGIMGSMIGTMFSVDNIFWFMPPFMLVNILIMIGLSIMLYEEVIEKHKPAHKPILFTTFFTWCSITTAIISFIILLGPRTGIAALG